MASNDISKGGSVSHQNLLILIWTCFSCAFLVVALRAFVRWKFVRTHRPTADDWWTLLALISLTALCVLDTIQLPSLYYITGVLEGTIPISADIIYHTQRHLRFQFPIVILYWTVLWSVKAAFLALYYRLFVDLTFYRRAWYFLAVFTALAYGGCITTLVLSCGPNVANFFGFATCQSPERVWSSNFSVYFSTIIDVFTDVCIMAMPLGLIWNVRVTWSQRIGLFAVFGLALFIIIFAIIRANQVLVDQQFVNLTLLMVWSTLVASISVIVGTLPALKALVTNRKKQHATNKSAESHNRSVRMGSMGSRKEKKSMGTNDSQEDILQQHQQPQPVVAEDPKLEVRIKRDVVSTPSWPLP
ncbi:hypothetical protein QBC38DRAFT_107148 [Podospora fimiseda]|uniref:Rhodopsin domain-containing protein n=1 Tax=Podospora fimiseda TaxID=252190 RepID=A0AAN6YPB3_9PEZI|nr:hypothetical protein QBC38DRAFT_107148 [Podospora fimiseda]